MHGYGVFTWADGRKFEGNYYEDLKTGHGIFYWPNGQIYEGFWKDGLQEGVGILTTVSRSRRFGRFRRGKLIKSIDEL